MPTPRALRLTSWLLAAAFLALFTAVALSPNRFVFDEPPYAQYVPLLHQHGLTPQYLNTLPGSAGPLFAFLHLAFEPLTNLAPVPMRLVNTLLLLAVAALLAATRKNLTTGATVLAVPMTWVVAGLALTEMSALVCVTASLYFQLRGLSELRSNRPTLLWFLLSGISLGAAVLGRQPYLLLCAVPLWIAVTEPRLRRDCLALIAIVAAMTLPLFLTWKGLVAPPYQEGQQGLSIANGLTSLGYAGVCFALLAPSAKWPAAKTTLLLVTATIIANALTSALAVYPFRSMAMRQLPAQALSIYGHLCGSVLLSAGVVFLAMLLQILWEGRRDLERLTINGGLLLVAASPMFVIHQYSSRYTAMALPWLVLATEPWKRWDRRTLITTALGCALGLVSLLGYYR